MLFLAIARPPTFQTAWSSVAPYFLAVAVAAFVLAAIVVWLRSRWNDNSEHAASALEMLSHYREMHLQGQLTEEEFRFIKSRTQGSEKVDGSPGSVKEAAKES